MFNGKLDEAEEIYNRMDRRDLSLHMRMRVGDWNKALSVFKEVNLKIKN